MKRKDVWRCVSKQAMTPDFTCPMRIWIFFTWENKWYLHRHSSLQHSFHPKLDHSATTLREKDLQDNDLKSVSFNDYFVWFYTIATGIYSICILLFQVNVLYDANVYITFSGECSVQGNVIIYFYCIYLYYYNLYIISYSFRIILICIISICIL